MLSTLLPGRRGNPPRLNRSCLIVAAAVLPVCPAHGRPWQRPHNHAPPVTQHLCRWAAPPPNLWWTRSCGCTAWRACAWWTPRWCPASQVRKGPLGVQQVVPRIPGKKPLTNPRGDWCAAAGDVCQGGESSALPASPLWAGGGGCFVQRQAGSPPNCFPAHLRRHSEWAPQLGS